MSIHKVGYFMDSLPQEFSRRDAQAAGLKINAWRSAYRPLLSAPSPSQAHAHGQGKPTHTGKVSPRTRAR